MFKEILALDDKELKSLLNALDDVKINLKIRSELRKGACKYSFNGVVFALISSRDLDLLIEDIEIKLGMIEAGR